MTGNAVGAPGLDDDLVAVLERPHVELTRGGLLPRPVGDAVDHQAAHAADALAAVVVERHRLLPVLHQLLVQHVEHLEERHLGGNIRQVVRLEPTLRAWRSPDARYGVSAS
jgi:hypothetical protein